MNVKFKRLLMIAAFINAGAGLFLLVCGILEFTGLIYTHANTTIESVGIQLSYLVFVSGALIFVSGFLTLLSHKELKHTNWLLFVGIVSLAWPIFVSISLFFSQYIICVRLLPAMLTSLFYVIAMLTVKIGNETFRKEHKFNPTAVVGSMGKRKSNVNVTKVFRNGKGKVKASGNIQAIGNLANTAGKHRKSFSLKRLFYGGSKRKSGGFKKGFYSGSRKRGGFRIRKR